MKKCYSECILLPTFEERLRYLQTAQHIGDRTFGGDRYLNQKFYTSKEWKDFRYKIVIRDFGSDLAIVEYPVYRGYIHHINPITAEQLKDGDDAIFDPENVILCSQKTHNAIHFSSNTAIYPALNVRQPGDTCPWR